MITLSTLRKASTFFHTDQFSVWNPVHERFDPGFTGRVYPFDRFKTIYHRPTRRETLGIRDSSSLPASRVIRHDVTAEVFIVGATLRSDSDNNRIYDIAYSLHRPSLLADLTRPTIQGAGDDLGPLVDIVVGKIHLDTELRTSEAENDAREKFKGQFFITMPSSYKVKQGDFLVCPDSTFRVQLVYEDGGYQMARADNIPDQRVVLTYKLPTNAGASYTPATGVYTGTTTVDRLFSALVSPIVRKDETDATEMQDKSVRITVEFDHIGFPPSPGEQILMGAEALTISAVRSDAESRQWLLTCRRGVNV